MRRILVGVIALAVGCTAGQQERKSDTLTAQEQATQQFQRATEAQKTAAAEQAKAEAAQRDVATAQKALADAQARERGQRARAEQAQREAQRLAEEAHQRGAEAQQEAAQRQQLQGQQSKALTESRQSWAQEKSLEGSVIQASGDRLKVRTRDLDTVDLAVTDATSVNLNGQTASLSQIQPGSDVRASYQMINGQAKAIHVDVTSKQQ